MARARPIAKWTGVVVTAITLIAYPVSMRWTIWGFAPSRLVTILGVGQLTLVRTDQWYDPSVTIHDAGSGLQWLFTASGKIGGVWILSMPLWSLALASAIPTVLLWRAERRAKPVGGCVNCGYSLTGLPAGQPCPECGGGGQG